MAAHPMSSDLHTPTLAPHSPSPARSPPLPTSNFVMCTHTGAPAARDLHDLARRVAKAGEAAGALEPAVPRVCGAVPGEGRKSAANGDQAAAGVGVVFGVQEVWGEGGQGWRPSWHMHS
eukprot:366442-Chlamydomonas_euryale.AAC.3